MSRDVNPFGLRMPPEVKEELEKLAEQNRRSLNAEIIYQLQAGMRITPPHATPEQVREIVTDVVKTELAKTMK